MNNREPISLVPGIPDDLFVRGNVPMTKAEVRAILISKLRLRSGSVVWDVGAGTGSISVEAALASPENKVYAVEYRPEAVELIRANRAKFGAENLEVVMGKAPEALLNLPSPDRVVIGGSGGKLSSILDVVKCRLPSGGIVVLTCVTVQTLYQALDYLSKKGVNQLEGVGISVTRLQPQGRYHMFQSLNPVFIVSGIQP